MTYLLIIAVALLLLALWKGKKRRPTPKRTERLHIDDELITTKQMMIRKGIGVR